MLLVLLFGACRSSTKVYKAEDIKGIEYKFIEYVADNQKGKTKVQNKFR